MFKINKRTGDIVTRQGDTWDLSVSGVSDDWDLYFSVYTADTREILFELNTNPVDGIALFEVNAENSDKLIVPEEKESETYYYGIKRCKNIDNKYVEDTLILQGKSVNDLNMITVYPLIVEGAENGKSKVWKR